MGSAEPSCLLGGVAGGVGFVGVHELGGAGPGEFGPVHHPGVGFGGDEAGRGVGEAAVGFGPPWEETVGLGAVGEPVGAVPPPHGPVVVAEPVSHFGHTAGVGVGAADGAGCLGADRFAEAVQRVEGAGPFVGPAGDEACSYMLGPFPVGCGDLPGVDLVG